MFKNCEDCGKYERIYAKGLCPVCYNVSVRRTGICECCGKKTPIHARKFCKQCYNKDYAKRRKNAKTLL